MPGVLAVLAVRDPGSRSVCQRRCTLGCGLDQAVLHSVRRKCMCRMEGDRVELRCAACGGQPCSKGNLESRPSFCPSEQEAEVLALAWATFQDEDTQRLALASARTEAAGYCKWPRVEEVMHFARGIGAKRLGIASCVGLICEAKLLQGILDANGFEVRSVCCKVGSVPKEDMGLKEDEKVRPGQYEPMCNPVAQAMLLNAAETQLNIVVGLCVGHDSIFFRHSKAPVTVLVAKDRVTGHNPVAALYTSHSYYKRLKQPG